MTTQNIDALFDLMEREMMGLTTDDVLLKPGESDVVPASVNLKTRITRGIESKRPLMCAAMHDISDGKMATKQAQNGCSAVLHRQFGLEWQIDHLRQTKLAASGFIPKPKTALEDETVAELLTRIQRRESQRQNVFHTFPVKNKDGAVVGLVTGKDLRRYRNKKSLRLGEIMTPLSKLIVAEPGTSFEQAYEKLTSFDKSVLMVFSDPTNLQGMYLLDAMQDLIEGANTVQNVDSKGRYIVGGAIGTSQSELENGIALIDEGIDFIVIDSAHGHSHAVFNQVKAVKSTRPHSQVMAGNIATSEAAIALCAAGADAIKVGVGPGSICTTRIVAGVGVPQLSAVYSAAIEARKRGVVVIADGGVRSSGDIVKLLAVGADIIMAGGMFAGSDEAPGEVIVHRGQQYKQYRGMGSASAMSERASQERYLQDSRKFVAEGVEGMVPYRGPVTNIIDTAIGGVKSGFGYVGAQNLQALRDRARMIRQTTNGLRESMPHDVIVDGVSTFQDA